MKNSNTKGSLIKNVIYTAFLILVVMTFALLLKGKGKRGVDYSFDDFSLYNWNDGWEVSRGGTELGKMDLPIDLNCEYGERIIIRKTLPRVIKDYNCLMIESKRQEIYSYVDGKRRTTYAEMDKIFTHTMPKAYILIPLYENDASKEIKLSISTDTYFSGDISDVYLGKESSLLLSLMKNDIPWVLIIVVILLIGIVCLVCFIIYYNSFEGKQPLIYIFWFALFCALYGVSQLKIRQLYTSDLALLESMGCCSFLLVPIPTIFIANWISKDRYRGIYTGIIILTMIDFLMQNILHSPIGYEYFEMQGLTQIIYLAIVLTILVLSIIDLIKGYFSEVYYLIIGVIALLMGTIAEAYCVAKHIDYTQGSYFAFASLIFTIILTLHMFMNLGEEQRRKKDAEIANKAKSQFLATMSHEIRTPINAVLGMNEMILRDSNEKMIKYYASNIADAGKSLLSLVNDVLDFSKIEAGKMDIVCVDYQIKPLLRDLIMMARTRLGDKKVELKLDIEESIPSKYHGDEVRIKQIVTNLLTNAVKYTGSGSITFSVKCEEILNDNINLRFSVKDTGMGIKEDDLKELMESSFIRVDKDKNRHIEGTGLGLSITRQLLELMGSKLEVNSEYGSGSEFYFTLSQKIVDSEPMGRIDDHEDIKTARKNGFVSPEARILAVDDTRTNLLVIRGLLKPYESKVDTCESAKRCLELCEENKYDLIFMDHMMPEMDGIEALNILRNGESANKNACVVALTANAVSGAGQIYKDSGFDGYLTKPIDLSELEECLRKHLPDEMIHEV